MEEVILEIIQIFKEISPFVVSIGTFFLVYSFIRILSKSYDAKIYNFVISFVVTLSLYFSTIFFFRLERFDYFFDVFKIVGHYVYCLGFCSYVILFEHSFNNIYPVFFLLLSDVLVKLTLLLEDDLRINISSLINLAIYKVKYYSTLIINKLKFIKKQLIDSMQSIKNILNNNLNIQFSTFIC